MFKRILVVEHDVMVRNVLVSIFARENYEVLEAEGGDEALKLLSMFDGTVNLIISNAPPTSSQLVSYKSGRILFFKIDDALRQILERQAGISAPSVKNLIAEVERLLRTKTE
jgi:CheY-like chemotaxis protein